MKKFLSLFLALVLICAMIPGASASTIYTAEEMKVKHDFQTEGVEDGKGAATYVEVEGGYYISPWKYDVENISLTVTYNGEDYKVKTKDLKLEGLKDVKVSVFEQDGKVVTSTESAPDGAKKIAKFKVDLENWTVIAMPKTEGLEMAVKFQYKDAKPDEAKNVDAVPLDTAAQEQAEAPAGSVQLIQDFKECKGVTDETKEIRTMLKPDENGVYFASRWNYKMATKAGDAGVGPNIDCKVVYNGSNKKMKGEDITPDANNCGTMYFFDQDGKLDVAAQVPQGATLLAECTMSLDGAIWFIPKSDKITTELEFNYDASETYDEAKNVDQVQNVKPGARTEAPAAPKFADVAADSPFAAAIDWAVEEGITKGKTETAFGPGDVCSVSHILAFLWRANGKPGAEEGTADSAALGKWAVEQKLIAEGESVSAPCTRVMAVTYLWKAAGEPAAETEIQFTDVDKDADYAPAVAWAVEKGITSGKTADTFAPTDTCTRGQIVTFLYRAARS
ncbi:S-layer homology domain-containing protein [uncultured Oscillibacter sp.]|uniref:S-layer homology domain-containing protein n=1 Tax=uncultured Oscillibacter sp. TaxID=876091 RepID=UPI0025FE2C70|nr:S-layer homology domain-containing protein [uncultured Oscillibacter sp.]